MLIRLNDIRVHYGKSEAVKGVSLEISEDEVVSIIGANGAGKSTVLKTIAGLKVPTSGEVLFQERRINGVPPHKIVQLGISLVPEGRGLFPYLSVADNLRLGSYSRKDKKTVASDLEAILQRFPILRQRKKQQASTLSGGEQQMLAIARGLMAHPHLLLLDEPSLGLSPLMVMELQHLIRDINQEGTSIILSEQNSSLALEVAHRAYVFETGLITLEGDTKELMKSSYVKKAYLGL